MNAPPRTGPRQRLAPLYVGSPIFARPSFPGAHPLNIRRAAAVEEMCRALGWLEQGFVASRPATRAEIAGFHDGDYLDALAEAERAGAAAREMRDQFALGTSANPIFPGMFERAATAVGGSMLAARLAQEGRVVFHPPGGTHHGGKARASGFCYLNDPVFAILEFLGLGAGKVAYVDFDAHHGDGVEDAFAHEPRVATISVHEADRWPRTGRLEDRGGGNARNLPVPRGLNDAEFAALVDGAVLPLLERFAPAAIVVVCGADALRGDPLAKLALSNGALWRAVEDVAALAGAVVVLGGGGYNPWNVVRCWSGLWGRLAGFAPPDPLPRAALAVLASLGGDRVGTAEPHWLMTLDDPPNAGPIRPEIGRIVEAALAP